MLMLQILLQVTVWCVIIPKYISLWYVHVQMVCYGSQMTVLLIFFASMLLSLSSAQDCDPGITLDVRTIIMYYSL